MRGNCFGKMLSMVTFGESHGPYMGVVIDGVPAGLDFILEDLQKELDRRAPGKIKGTTSRTEADLAQVLSGTYEGKTLGSPIAVIVKNTNQKSDDYKKLEKQFRPGHADQTTLHKYGIRDHRGGGRSSGRETLSRVIGGYFAGLILPSIKVRGVATQIGPFKASKFIPENLPNELGPYSYPDPDMDNTIEKFLLEQKVKGDSVGGKVSIYINNCPVGLGEPAFDKLKADFAKGLLSIGGLVSFSFGLGEEMADLPGSYVSQSSSNFGGIEGGISNGETIILNCTFKPTSTVGEKAREGRHDPCIVPRAIPVVEAMVRFVLADHFLRQRAYQC